MGASDSDFRGVWAERLAIRRDRAVSAFDRVCARSMAAFWDIQLGEGCLFLGRPIFRRWPHSTISIGPRCEFRSSPGSNRVGVNRPCMVSTILPGARVSLGARCGLSGTVIAAAEEIVIGDRVLCGANVTITDNDWHGLRPDERHLPGESAPVHIGDDVWLGLGVVVLKGVTIGAGSVIAAGSIVAESIPEGVIAAGNPAKVVRTMG